jgi:RimJ/RimL family protein N-acetyltransferase
MSDDIRIVPMTEAHIAGLQRCVDAVARERRWLGFLEGPPLVATQAFVDSILRGAGVQFVALNEADDVVGWCDIVRLDMETFRHGWRLGMGLLPAMRGRGIGRRLAEAAIAAARAQGAERIELDVFASNRRAIALYEKLGFVQEGVKRRARKLDGAYDDVVLMALLTDDGGERRP